MQNLLIKRPKILTFVCVMGFIWVVVSLPGVFAPSVKKINDWMPALLGAIRAAMFISLIGVWFLKQWGVRLFIMVFFIKETTFYLIEDTSYIGIFLSVFFIACMLPFYRRLNPNL